MWRGGGLISSLLWEGEKSASLCVLLLLTCPLPAVVTHRAVLEQLRVSLLSASLEVWGAGLLPLSEPALVSE